MTKKPRAAKSRRAPQELTRKQISRRDRERRMERGLIIGVAVVAVVVIGLIAYGLAVENIIKARQVVAVVGDVPLRAVEFQAQVRLMRMEMQLELNNWQNQRMSLDPGDESAEFYLNYIDERVRALEANLSEGNALAIGVEALDRLVLYELVRQEAERRGIVVTEDEVQRKVELDLNYDRTAPTLPLTATSVLTAEAPPPTPVTEEDFRQQYDTIINDLLKPLDISERQYRSWIEADLLVQRLAEDMAKEVPGDADQVRLRLLSVESEAEASEFVARLDAGESFQTLADEVEVDEETTASVTELEWLPRTLIEGGLGTEVADLAFSLDVGDYSRPTPGLEGGRYYIIEVLGHEVRELDETVREQLGNEAFQDWVDAQQVVVERKPYSDLVPTEP
jgi:parvulin-like peptidyl-prolyl isomerase